MGILLRSPQAGRVLELSDLRNPSLVSDLRTLAEYQSPSCHLCYVPKFLNKTSEKVFRFHLESHTPATGPTWWGGDLCTLHRALLGASTWERGAKKGRSISDAGVGARVEAGAQLLLEHPQDLHTEPPHSPHLRSASFPPSDLPSPGPSPTA